MAKTYLEYQHEIEKLKELAEAAKKSELAAAKEQIFEIMRTHGLSSADISNSRMKEFKPKKEVAVKYHDEKTGQTWTGRGRSPKWLEGKNKDDFLIK